MNCARILWTPFKLALPVLSAASSLPLPHYPLLLALPLLDMLPTPTPSPVPSLPRALARGDDELCTSGSEREWDELIAAFPLPEQAQCAPPTTRPRSASLSADIMRNDARRAEAASVHLDEGRTDSVPVNDGEVEQQVCLASFKRIAVYEVLK